MGGWGGTRSQQVATLPWRPALPMGRACRYFTPLNPSTSAWKRSLSLFGTGFPVTGSITVSTFHQSASRKEWYVQSQPYSS